MAHAIVMPSLGMFTAEGTLTRWLKPPDARVTQGEPIAEVTTEKAVFEVPAPASGRLAHVAGEGTTLAVETLLGYVLADGEAVPPAAGVPAAAAVAAVPVAPAVTAAPAAPGDGERLRASPAARRLAAERGVDLAAVTPTGPGGRIVEADVLAAAAHPAASSAAGRRIRERVALTAMRRTIAERLRASLATAASLTLTREVEAAALVAARHRLGERLGIDLPYDALFVKLFADALAERGDLNAVIEDDAILRLEDVDVGFAVAIPAGLVVPVVRHADREPLKAIAAAVADRIERARAGRLRPEEVEGGSATVSNLGAHGIDAFTPILNAPQSAILGLGRIAARPVVRGEALVPGLTIVLSLTFDHRVADGVPAAQLLDAFARRMNDEAYLQALA